MKNKEQIEKIQKIMAGENKGPKTNWEDFTLEEKLTAIYRWKRHSGVNFDLTFVESVHESYIKYKKVSEKQMAGIDKIIARFNIDLDTWSV